MSANWVDAVVLADSIKTDGDAEAKGHELAAIILAIHRSLASTGRAGPDYLYYLGPEEVTCILALLRGLPPARPALVEHLIKKLAGASSEAT